MNRTLLLFASLIFAVSCAKVQVQAPKEPIKVDISMRLDVYQHVEKDIDQIENIVSGDAGKPQSHLLNGFTDFFVTEAYALEGLSPDVEQAALRRRDRRDQLSAWLAKGVIGENKSGMIEIRQPGQADAAVKALIEAENSDRSLIYAGVAQKNGTSITEVQKLYAARLQEDAPAGSPIEVESGGSSEWKIK